MQEADSPMPRTTIDFGIDLGTTNSEIAVLDKAQVRVIRNSFHDEATPSAVRIDPKGTVIVGKLAYNERVADHKNTHVQFKRLMGSQQILSFDASGRKMRPEELSAEVLKSLRQDAARELGEEIKSCVITVPALFEIPQCDATRRAAEMAGIAVSPLLQEPIAAALAYGFQAEDLDGFLFVYDFGGGTFDASIIRSVNGRLTVVDHAGDNFLGGKDCDDKLVEHFIKILRRNFGLRPLDQEKDSSALAKLTFHAENAKIQLANADKASVEINGLGKELPDFEAIFEINRSEYERLIESIVSRTVSVCQGLLDANNLSKSAVSRVILVGGPTYSPFIRNAVEEALGVKPEFKVDPITIVAQGAAIFAASQRLPEVRPASVGKGTLSLKLVYTPVSQDTETDVAGKITNAENNSATRLEITRTDGGWTSGQLALSNATFMTAVLLNKRSVNEFLIRALDARGSSLNIVPDRFSITHGPVALEAPLSRSIRLGLSDGSTELLIPKGTTVPCKAAPKAVTAHDVAKGESRDILRIPLLQGEHERSNENREIGTLEISGSDISRSLPANSEVELLVDVDSSFHVRVKAFVPLLSQPFEDVLPISLTPLPVCEVMEAEMVAERQRLEEIVRNVDSKEIRLEGVSVGAVQERALEVNEQLEKAKGNNPDAAEKARRAIEDFRAEVNRLEAAQKWPLLLHRLQEAKQFASEAVESSTEQKDPEKLAKLLADAERVVVTKDAARLERQIVALESLAWEIWARQDAFWIASFQQVAKYTANFTDHQRGNALLEEGTLAVERGDFASLRTIVRELWGLVPETEETSKEKMRFPSSLRKRSVGYL
jgi:molecular chaperone DnaK